jgi:hypothetical protein
VGADEAHGRDDVRNHVTGAATLVTVLATVTIVAVGVFTLICSVGAIVTTLRHPLPALDPETFRRVTRALDRGRLPPEGPDRAAAIHMAQVRSRHYWSALASVGLAAGLMLALLYTPIPPAMPIVAAGLVLIGGLIEAYITVSAQRALAAA